MLRDLLFLLPERLQEYQEFSRLAHCNNQRISRFGRIPVTKLGRMLNFNRYTGQRSIKYSPTMHACRAVPQATKIMRSKFRSSSSCPSRPPISRLFHHLQNDHEVYFLRLQVAHKFLFHVGIKISQVQPLRIFDQQDVRIAWAS